MRFGMILDVTFRILRRHWSPLLIIALLFAGPAGLISATTGIRLTEVALDAIPGFDEGVIDLDTPITAAAMDRIYEALGAYALASVVAGVLTSIGALIFSAIVAADYHARRPALGEVLRAALRRLPTLLAFMLVTSLLVLTLIVMGVVLALVAMSVLPASGSGGPGMFLSLIVAVAVAVGLVYVSMRWAPAFPAMIEEGLGLRATLRRCWELSGDNVWRIFGVVLFGALATSAVNAILSQVLSLVVVGGLADPLGIDTLILQSLALTAVSVVVAPISPVLVAVLYFDLRARRDIATAAAPEPGHER